MPRSFGERDAFLVAFFFFVFFIVSGVKVAWDFGTLEEAARDPGDSASLSEFPVLG